MPSTISRLQDKLSAGKRIVISDLNPPPGSDPALLAAVCKEFSGKADALGISDNREGIAMSAVAAASVVLSYGIEPILHMTTRDRNRIALISDSLGAHALGIKNLLVTSGTHQTLGSYSHAKNVYDIDTIQLLTLLADLGGNGARGQSDGTHFFKGAVIDPFADPVDMQIIQAEKKILAGAEYLITKPVYDLDKFNAWWKKIAERGLDEQVFVIAGVNILSGFEEAFALSKKRPDPAIPGPLLARLESIPSVDGRKEEGKKIALETIDALLSIDKIRGIEITSDHEYSSVIAVIGVVRKSGV